jgi:putative ABC transport system permease protein
VRLSDLISLPLAALWQQKTRTLLTTMGVVFGTFVLAASLSTNQGVQDAISRELGEGDALRRVQVREQNGGPARHELQLKGQMSEAQRERLRQALQTRKQWEDPEPPEHIVNQEKLNAIAKLEHVEKVVAMSMQNGSVTIDGHMDFANAFGVAPDSEFHRKRMIAGRFFNDPNERSAIVNEVLAYRLGFIDEASMTGLVGKTLRFQIRQIHGYGAAASTRRAGSGRNRALGRGQQDAALALLARQLPTFLAGLGLSSKGQAAGQRRADSSVATDADTLTREFTIVGISRLSDAKEREDRWDMLNQDAELLLPAQTAVDMFFAVPRQAVQGVAAAVMVDREPNVDGVVERIKGMGVSAFAFREGLKRERLMYSLIFRSMTCIAAVALLVAALGIANTMLMSVLERTREIGIMKAVGAGNGQLQVIFLIEGAIIGFAGGGVGLLLALGASFPGDLWVRSMVSRDMKVDLKGTLFVFPPWLTLTVMVFAVLVTTLAAVYPARRAAKIDTVAALRHE